MRNLALFFALLVVTFFLFTLVACDAFNICEGEEAQSAAEVHRDTMTLVFRDLPQGDWGSGFFQAVADLGSSGPGSVHVTFFFRAGGSEEVDWTMRSLLDHPDWSVRDFTADDILLLVASEEVVISAGVILTSSSYLDFCPGSDAKAPRTN